jgi:hypothetical protein
MSESTANLDFNCPTCGTHQQVRLFRDQNGDWRLDWSWAQDTATATATRQGDG